MIELESKYQCCGCEACYNVCPSYAIRMEEDEEGFVYPQFIKDRCIGCGKCKQACPFIHNDSIHSAMSVYAVKHIDESVRYKSSSGGFFSLIASYILNRGGVIYGAVFDDNLTVRHLRVDNFHNISKLRGAKYVQSRMFDTYQSVKKDIKDGKHVLFSGTPCQVAALNNMMGGEKDNPQLLTCDLVCHGVPSPMIWSAYLGLIGGGKYAEFRNKSNGWHQSHVTIKDFDENTKISERHDVNPYMQLYFRHYSLRPSCSVCPYAKTERSGDFTIGDFWGIDKIAPDFDDNRGVSLVFANNQKALNIFSQLQGFMEWKATTLSQALQPNLVSPSSLSVYRGDFWKIYKKRGFEDAVLLFTSQGDKSYIIKIQRLILKILRKVKCIAYDCH